MMPSAVLCALALAGIAVSLCALFLCRAMVSAGEQRSDAAGKQFQQRLDALALEVHELRREPPPAPLAVPPKPSFNLSKRSQALRMHRRGDPIEQIAASLDAPRQEVELLLKVHCIVMSNI